MKILHVTGSLDLAMGGLPAVVTRLAAAQAASGHTVRICSNDRSNRQLIIHDALACVPGFAAVHTEHLKPPRGIERIICRRTCRQLRGQVAWADIVHLHGVWETILRATGIECYRQGRSYLVTPHGMLDPWSLGQKKWKKRLALMLGYRKMLNSAVGLHLLNVDEKRLIGPLRLTSPQLVIPNGVFLEEIEPLPPKGRFYASYSQLESRPFILFLGRLHYKKGLDYLAQAFAIIAPQNRDVRLVVAGPDEGYRDIFEQTIKKLGLTDRVHLIGPIYGQDKLAALIDTDCFCLPSHQEGFSIAVTEAMACGAPVVISQGCHFPEVTQVGAGEVVQLDASAVAKALERVLSDQALRDRMGQAGRKLVASRYTWPKVADQTIEAYHHALNGQPTSIRE